MGYDCASGQTVDTTTIAAACGASGYTCGAVPAGSGACGASENTHCYCNAGTTADACTYMCTGTIASTGATSMGYDCASGQTVNTTAIAAACGSSGYTCGAVPAGSGACGASENTHCYCN
jgi:hypothetical protein